MASTTLFDALDRSDASGKSRNALKTISEVADLLDIPQHVLRFWETKFPQIKPMKRNGGRRFYRPEDIEVLLQIKNLLYKQGYTIKGAKKAFEQRVVGNDNVRPEEQDANTTVGAIVEDVKAPVEDATSDNADHASLAQLRTIRNELSELRDMLNIRKAIAG